MLEDKTARTPHTLRDAGGWFRPLRSLTCRTYVHTPGRVILFFFYVLAVCMKEKAQHGTAALQKRYKLNRIFWKEKKSTSPHVLIFCLIGTPCTGQKRNKSNSRALSASYAARSSRDHLATDSVRVKLSSLSATVRPVARLA